MYINGILPKEGGIPEMEKVKQHLEMLRGMGLRPNFSELARIYGIDRRTVKKYWEGYQGKPKKRKG
ncbi:hypothetical protein XO09_08975 [Thermosipho sp. 1223]|nr:hypothetical protein XO09_08975 [Thermosipho sp. 1223]